MVIYLVIEMRLSSIYKKYGKVIFHFEKMRYTSSVEKKMRLSSNNEKLWFYCIFEKIEVVFHFWEKLSPPSIRQNIEANFHLIRPSIVYTQIFMTLEDFK
jgi:hypothetical protein